MTLEFESASDEFAECGGGGCCLAVGDLDEEEEETAECGGGGCCLAVGDLDEDEEDDEG